MSGAAVFIPFMNAYGPYLMQLGIGTWAAVNTTVTPAPNMEPPWRQQQPMPGPPQGSLTGASLFTPGTHPLPDPGRLRPTEPAGPPPGWQGMPNQLFRPTPPAGPPPGWQCMPDPGVQGPQGPGWTHPAVQGPGWTDGGTDPAVQGAAVQGRDWVRPDAGAPPGLWYPPGVPGDPPAAGMAAASSWEVPAPLFTPTAPSEPPPATINLTQADQGSGNAGEGDGHEAVQNWGDWEDWLRAERPTEVSARGTWYYWRSNNQRVEWRGSRSNNPTRCNQCEQICYLGKGWCWLCGYIGNKGKGHSKGNRKGSSWHQQQHQQQQPQQQSRGRRPRQRDRGEDEQLLATANHSDPAEQSAAWAAAGFSPDVASAAATLGFVEPMPVTPFSGPAQTLVPEPANPQETQAPPHNLADAPTEILDSVDEVAANDLQATAAEIAAREAEYANAALQATEEAAAAATKAENEAKARYEKAMQDAQLAREAAENAQQLTAQAAQNAQAELDAQAAQAAAEEERQKKRAQAAQAAIERDRSAKAEADAEKKAAQAAAQQVVAERRAAEKRAAAAKAHAEAKAAADRAAALEAEAEADEAEEERRRADEEAQREESSKEEAAATADAEMAEKSAADRSAESSAPSRTEAVAPATSDSNAADAEGAAATQTSAATDAECPAEVPPGGEQKDEAAGREHADGKADRKSDDDAA